MMSLESVGVFAVATFLSGWYINALVNLAPEGSRRPLVVWFLSALLPRAALMVGLVCLMAWLVEHRLPTSELLINTLAVVSAGFAEQSYKQVRAEWSSTSSRPKRRKPAAYREAHP